MIVAIEEMHKCPIGGCGEEVEATKLMCPEHWRLVPAMLQMSVERAFRYGSVVEHAAFCRSAIECVEGVRRPSS